MSVRTRRRSTVSNDWPEGTLGRQMADVQRGLAGLRRCRAERMAKPARGRCGGVASDRGGLGAELAMDRSTVTRTAVATAEPDDERRRLLARIAALLRTPLTWISRRP